MRTYLLILVSIFLPAIAFAQKAITGQVLDNFNEPIIGASVLEKGTTNGTITDLDGNFNLTVSPKSTLVISYIGYATQEILVTDRSSFKIVLKGRSLNFPWQAPEVLTKDGAYTIQEERDVRNAMQLCSESFDL